MSRKESTMADLPVLVCPACEKAEELWETVLYEGWQSIDARQDERGRPVTAYAKGRGWPDHEVDKYSPVERTGDCGCSCGWEGQTRELVRLGLDGKQLPPVDPRQMALGDQRA